MKKLLLGLTAAVAMMFTVPANAETQDCTEITTIPTVITVQGVYCLKGNLLTATTSGNAITINTNNVTIDMNGFKLGGSAAGAGTWAVGIGANGRKNITIRNGSIRGFYEGISLSGSGHLIEQIRADGNTAVAFNVYGNNNIIRNNHVINTGSSANTNISYGMIIQFANNTLIADNVISSVSETNVAYGIFIDEISRVEVRGNSIFEIKDATTIYGIYFSNSSGMTIHENQINNTGTSGTTGIIDGGGTSSGVACLNNVTIDYFTAHSGCDLVAGHQNL